MMMDYLKFARLREWNRFRYGIRFDECMGMDDGQEEDNEVWIRMELVTDILYDQMSEK